MFSLFSLLSQVLFRGVTLPPSPMALITDYCEGGCLRDYLDKRKHALSVHKQIKLALDIAKGMVRVQGPR